VGIVGRFIDGITPEQRDRIVTAHDFEYAAVFRGSYGNGMTAVGEGMCLIDTVFNESGAWHKYTLVDHIVPNRRATFALGYRFDELCCRFGPARVIRACKLRAAGIRLVNNSQDIDIQRLLNAISLDLHGRKV
jgi:hypothetical protein